MSANTDSTYEPGFIEWEINPLERLFVEGSDVEEAVLQRGQTDSAVGGFTVGLTNGPVPVFTLQSSPVEQPVEAQVFMSVYFSAIIEGGGGPQSYSADLDGLRHHAHLQREQRQHRGNILHGVTLKPGHLRRRRRHELLRRGAKHDSYLGRRSIHHAHRVRRTCIGTQARVQWGGFEQNSGGIVIEGVLYEPKADITVDAARLAHVELEHRLPWGLEDLRMKNGRFGDRSSRQIHSRMANTWSRPVQGTIRITTWAATTPSTRGRAPNRCPSAN